MSTPNPPNTKLEGLNLYAPRGGQTPFAQGSGDLPSHTCPDVSEGDALCAEGKQPPAAATESLETRRSAMLTKQQFHSATQIFHFRALSSANPEIEI